MAKYQKNSPIKIKESNYDDYISNIQNLALEILAEIRDFRKERKTWVSVLHNEGLSQEEIAKVLSVPQATVSRIILASEEEN